MKTIQEQVAEAKQKDGFYIVTDSRHPGSEVPIVSHKGQLLRMTIGQPLADDGWYDTAQFHGPYRP